jgi:hypothetical protein
MPTTSASPKGILRAILRLSRTPVLPPELARRAAAANPSGSHNAARAYVLEQYRLDKARRANQLHENHLVDVEERLVLRMAETFHSLQQDLAERGKLYNLDTGAEVVLSPKEMSRRAAARAGLQLPSEPIFEEVEGQQGSVGHPSVVK